VNTPSMNAAAAARSPRRMSDSGSSLRQL